MKTDKVMDMGHITIKYNIVAEFIFSIMRIFDQNDLFENGKVLVIHNRELERYCQNVRTKLEPFIKSEIRQFINGFNGGMLALIDYCVSSEFANIEDFISHIEGMTSKELVGIYLKEYHINDLTPDSPKGEIVKAVKAKVETRLASKEGKYIKLLLRGEETKEQMTGYFKHYYKTFFSQIETQIMEKLEEIKVRHERMVKTNRQMFLDHIFPFLRNEDIKLEQLSIYVSYTGEISNMLWRYEGEKQIRYIYGVAHEQKMDKDYTSVIRKEFLKLLQDDTRYGILKLLGEKKWYGKELADHFGLTTATMSYHLNRLTNFGVVDIEKGVSKRYYYSLNKEAIKKLYLRVLDDLLEGEFDEVDR